MMNTDMRSCNLSAKIMFRHKIKFQHAEFQIRVSIRITDISSMTVLPFVPGSMARFHYPIRLFVKC